MKFDSNSLKFSLKNVTSYKVNFYYQSLYSSTMKDLSIYNSSNYLFQSINTLFMFLSIIPFLKKLIVSFHRANLIYRYLRNDYNSFRNSFLKLNISRVSIGKVDKLRNKGSMKFNLKTNIFNRKIHFKYHKNHSMSLFINIKKFLKSTKKNILTKKKSKKSFKEHNYNSHEKFVSMRRLFYSKSIQLFTPYRKFKLKYLHLDLFRKYSSTVVSSYPEKLKFPRSLFLEKKKT